MNSVLAILLVAGVLMVLYRVSCNEAQMHVRQEDERLLAAQRDIIGALSSPMELSGDVDGGSGFPTELTYTEGGEVRVAKKGTQTYDDILKSF